MADGIRFGTHGHTTAVLRRGDGIVSLVNSRDGNLMGVAAFIAALLGLVGGLLVGVPATLLGAGHVTNRAPAVRCPCLGAFVRRKDPSRDSLRSSGMPHAVAAAVLGMDLGTPFQRGRGGPGGWWLIDEPELHLGTEPDIVVPDLGGWRRIEPFEAVELELAALWGKSA